MYIYTIRQWLLFFYTYCFFGWIFESTYVSLKTRKWTNRGFMHGPFLPIYGSGAIICLFATIPFRGNYIGMYFAGAIAATVLEYVTGVVMEAMFKVRYWDYSYKKIQFQGHICLTSTIAWGFFAILLVEVLHKPVERINLAIAEIANGYLEEIIVFVVTIYFVADITIAFREAYELRDVLIYLEKIKDKAKAGALAEVEMIKHRVDLMADRVSHRLLTVYPTAKSSRYHESLSMIREHIANRKNKVKQSVLEVLYKKEN